VLRGGIGNDRRAGTVEGPVYLMETIATFGFCCCLCWERVVESYARRGVIDTPVELGARGRRGKDENYGNFWGRRQIPVIFTEQ
jgi:hypothetical protein